MADSCESASVGVEETSDKDAVLSEKETDRPCESIDSSDCSNHSTTTDKDTEQSSDSESKQPSATSGSVCIRPNPVLRPSSFGTPPLITVRGAAPVTSSKMILKPSALADQASKLNTYSFKATGSANNKPEFNLKPALANPFSKDAADVENGSTTIEKEKSKEAEGAATGGFVFGQNLHERVANVEHSDEENKQNSSLFHASASQNKSEATNNENSPNKSLVESAQEYEAAKQVKRKYDEVEVKTGEEDESNVLQIDCKLYAFKEGTYQEKGRGVLRLNDSSSKGDAFYSRVVVRVVGKVRLNTVVCSAMEVEKASDKTVRLTARVDDQFRVFLVMASQKDSETLYNALNSRITALKCQEDVAGEKGLQFLQHNPPKKLRSNLEERR